MVRFNWIWLLASVLLIGLVLSQPAQEDDDMDDSEVEIEAEGEEEPKKGGFQLNLVDENTDPGADVFIPTKEWQTVKKDQPVPRGLHYRLNLETGLTEAKLLDESEDTNNAEEVTKPASDLVATGIDSSESESVSFEETKRLRMKMAMEEAMRELNDKEDKEGADNLQYWQDGDKEGMVNLKKKSFSREELKDALKKFKKKDDDVKDESGNAKNKYRSMQDIKKDFDELNLQMKTDTEILRELLTKYEDEQLDTDDRVGVLTDLEYYLHQIDNAVVFADMGGLDLIIKDLNHTSAEVRTEAAFVIGSSTQSNPKVQVRVLKSGGIHQMIRMLSTESSDAVKNRVLYALSCTLRHFPFAQKSFVDNGGVQTLTHILSQSTSNKLRLKAMTLAMDMLHERELAELHTRIAKSSEFEKLQQYKQVHVRSALLEKGWCDLVPKLLTDPDHDTREKVLTPMGLLVNSCKSSFLQSKNTLINLQSEYSKLTQQEIEEEGEKGYFGGLLKLINDILDKLNSPEQILLKEEL